MTAQDEERGDARAFERRRIRRHLEVCRGDTLGREAVAAAAVRASGRGALDSSSSEARGVWASQPSPVPSARASTASAGLAYDICGICSSAAVWAKSGGTQSAGSSRIARAHELGWRAASSRTSRPPKLWPIQSPASRGCSRPRRRRAARSSRLFPAGAAVAAQVEGADTVVGSEAFLGKAAEPSAVGRDAVEADDRWGVLGAPDVLVELREASPRARPRAAAVSRASRRRGPRPRARRWGRARSHSGPRSRPP